VKTESRGPSKDGKRQLSVFLTDEEYAGLVAMAEREFRTASQQVRALIVQAIDKAKEAK
jgi:hypothetical protein